MAGSEPCRFLAVTRRPLRDNEEIVDGFCDLQDRVSVVVRRRRGGGLGACEPPSLTQGLLVPGRTLASLRQIVLLDSFARLRGDLKRLMAAGFLGRLFLASWPEGVGGGEGFSLLLELFKALDDGASPVGAGLWGQDRLLLLLGVAPDFECCVSCGRSELSAYSAFEGGMLCQACFSGRGFRVSGEALSWCRSVRQARLGQVVVPPGTVLTEAGRLYRDQFVEHVGVSRSVFKRVLSRGGEQ